MILGIMIGVLSAWLVALLGLLTLDADLRRAAGQTLLAVILGPAFLVVTMARRGPLAARIQPRAVERFVRMLDEDMEPAWVLDE